MQWNDFLRMLRDSGVKSVTFDLTGLALSDRDRIATQPAKPTVAPEPVVHYSEPDDEPETAVETAVEPKPEPKPEPRPTQGKRALPTDRPLFDELVDILAKDDGEKIDVSYIIEEMSLSDLNKINKEYGLELLGVDTDVPLEELRKSIIECFRVD